MRENQDPPADGETPDGAQGEAQGSGTTLLESYRHSLRLQEMRIASLQESLEERVLRVEGLERSASWRVTSPIRLVRSLAAGRLPSGLMLRDIGRRIGDIAETEGAGGLRKRLAIRLRHHVINRFRRARPRIRSGLSDAPWTLATDPARLRRSVLIVAELSVPQCAKYRVWQKQEHLRRLGWPCVVVDWHETAAAFSSLQCCTRVVFYRVPARPSVLGLIAEARRLGLHPIWEVDDLIFDEPLYRRNANLATLPSRLRDEVLAGVRLYRQAMLACGRGIASTEVLARCMREAGLAEATCIENALDDETLAVARTLRGERAGRSGPPMIVYGSGTKTHDADFAVAAPAIERLLRAHPALRLRIIGDLNLPKSMAEYAGRIERLAGTNYVAYLRLLGEGDIAIAPLEATLFNDAKSNIKFQEAAILEMPSVCSPRAAFRDVVFDDRNGLLAESDAEWERALDRLVRDPELRARLGRQALEDVVRRYAPERIATEQVLPLFGAPEPAPDQRRTAGLRVLVVNVFFSPRSFGGATIVAEQLARRLQRRDDVEVAVFTSHGETEARAEALLRYDWQGVTVFAAPLPPPGDHVAGFDNPAAVRHFAAVLEAIRPDVVHAHSIQGFGAGILRLCQERGVPYVITLHDAWWLCDRQFMVRGDGRYCFQTRIDQRVCQACVPGARHLEARDAILRQVLHGAAHLLCPSETHRGLYLANGVAPASVGVNRNGIRAPSRPRAARRPGTPPRFGFVGGNEPIKGFHLLRAAFESLASEPWELVLVDNTLNLGFSSIDVSDWRVPGRGVPGGVPGTVPGLPSGRIEVVAAYGQDGLDDFFDRIDVLLFPSQWKESYGLTVREALARDVWVVATAPGGQADDIVDGVNGRLIPLDGRSDGLISAIGEILLAPAMLEGYVNTHRLALADYDTQADDLHAVLCRAAARSDAELQPAGRHLSP